MGVGWCEFGPARVGGRAGVRGNVVGGWGDVLVGVERGTWGSGVGMWGCGYLDRGMCGCEV